MNKQIILASTSPFRKKILEQTGLLFKAMNSGYEEDKSISDNPEELVIKLSEGKALSLKSKIKDDAVIIGSDQVFVAGGKIYGKAFNRSEAFNRLKMLSGTNHKLVTGLYVIDTEKNISKSCADVVDIYMRNLVDDDINKYLDTGEWEGVAGSYRIEGQGVKLLEKISGDYYSVIGLPIFKLLNILEELGIKLF